MKSLSILVVVIAYLICGFGLSFSKLVMFSFEEKVKRSDIIIHGRVNGINRNILSENRAIVDVNQVVAGELREKQVKIKFGRKCDLPKSSHTLCRISGHKKSVVFWCFAELNRSFGEDVA
jgi:hypothetical protein